METRPAQFSNYLQKGSVRVLPFCQRRGTIDEIRVPRPQELPVKWWVAMSSWLRIQSV